MSVVRSFRLHFREFWVDARVFEVNGRWLASADTPHGPSAGIGVTAIEALADALEAFDGAVHELLETAPADLFGMGSGHTSAE